MDWQIITAVATAGAVVVTILVYRATASREENIKLIDNLNTLYYRTFSLRGTVSSITTEDYGEEFYYELDNMLQNDRIQNSVLDYLSEMENFFFLVVGHKSVAKTFEKFMSLSLYLRLTVFYGFILHQRKHTKNLFLNYEKVLLQIRKMKKITSQIPNYQYKCYVGIRESDCQYANNYFSSNITMFSEEIGTSTFPIRPNQNKANKYVIPFMTDRIERLINQNDQWRFIFYNNTMAYNFPPEMQNHFICLNERDLLQFLNNKAEAKQWLSKCQVPILAFETFLGQEITLDVLKKHFSWTKRYVIQSNSGGGGIGTFLTSAENFYTVKSMLQPLRQYLVTAYIEQSISVNTHIFISDKQTVLSPGSVQIVECLQDQLCYRGADFIAFRTLPESCREDVRKWSLKIANRLREKGYRGVAGVDFLITAQGEVFCMEVNPRFQASTILLDLYLKNQGENLANSTFELNEQAFENRMMSTLCYEDEINFSCYYYYKDNLELEDFLAKREQLLEEGILIDDDGFLLFDDINLVDSDSYLFRAVFPHAICGISPDMTLWLNDNIPVRDAPSDLMDLKIALLNQGVRTRLSDEAIKEGVYNSKDIHFVGQDYCTKPTAMNCAYEINLSQYSPFVIESTDKGSVLTYYGRKLGTAIVEQDKLKMLSDIDRRILYIATDRLRIKLVAGCEYKNIGCGCRFCNLPLSRKRFSHLEIKNALDNLKRLNLSFRHILIGGGTCTSPDIWDDIIWLCNLLKSDDYYRNKPISLMSILPPEEKLRELNESGLEEVAFNIEIVDEENAKKWMPGKRRQGKKAYYSILEKSVSIFGIGKVRSALLVGLDHENTLVNEVEHLASLRVIPCLSAFRALPGADSCSMLHPTNQYLRTIYDECMARLSALDGPVTELGPKCGECRNNMLSI